MQTIVIIEDELDLAELLAFNLTREGYRALTAGDGRTGMDLVRQELPELVLLDLMLPEMMGTEVCRELKREVATASIPVLMLTAKGEEIDRVVGFEVGADDYVVKPFSMRELVLRVKAVLRRGVAEPPATKIMTYGLLQIDTERHEVRVAGQEIVLTSTEYKLLLTLAERQGRLQSRDRLLDDVWGYAADVDSRTVDTHITRLRGKLGVAGDLIKTVRGFGYKLEAP
jgi:two-component system, OmpR family, phosphate regulon response regulator PhoB